MLVLSRKVGERILVGDEIRITVVRVTSSGVRIGIEAPDGTTVVREELTLKLAQESKHSGGRGGSTQPTGRTVASNDASSER